MSTSSITIKPNNHRVYQCPADKKVELLNKVIAENEKLEIIVACSKDVEIIKNMLQNQKITVIEDRDLIKNKELSCELLISFDMPIKGIVYMARVAKATQKAIFFIDESEQKGLHDIEMLLGRSIKQDIIDGFEYEVIEKVESDRPAPRKMTKDQIKEEAKKRYDKVTAEPKEKSYKPKRDYGDDDKKTYSKDGKKKDFNKSDSAGKWDKKKKEPNKYLGKDENGKAIFSGKSGERNHRYDGSPKSKWDAPKKVGKRISIKERKPKTDSQE
jgi:hypothetical protein